MKRSAFLVLIVCSLSLPLYAWEILTTQSGVTVAGDITQSEFVLDDPSGGEIIIPRAAIDHFQFDGELMEATLKDGTQVVGELKSPIEIQDGSIRRRFQGPSVQSIKFDTFIPLQSGQRYHSCPIRLSLPADRIISEPSGWSTTLSGAVNCNDQKIVNITFQPRGKLEKGRGASLKARFTVWVPPGPNQLAELYIEMVQEQTVLGAGRKRLTLDDGEMNQVTMKFDLSRAPYKPDGPKPRFQVQLVTQNEDQEIERGGVFWWFTIPIPL